MDILDKHAATWERHRLALAAGQDPFGVCFDAILSPTHARVGDKLILLFGTNNYLGLTFDPACVDAASAALRSHGTGTTGSRIANGTFALHRALEQRIAAFMKRRFGHDFNPLTEIVPLIGSKEGLSHLAFAFRITPAVMGAGMGFALFMGLVGGLPPAVRAARLPVAVALRDL